MSKVNIQTTFGEVEVTVTGMNSVNIEFSTLNVLPYGTYKGSMKLRNYSNIPRHLSFDLENGKGYGASTPSSASFIIKSELNLRPNLDVRNIIKNSIIEAVNTYMALNLPILKKANRLLKSSEVKRLDEILLKVKDRPDTKGKRELVDRIEARIEEFELSNDDEEVMPYSDKELRINLSAGL